MLTRPGLDDLHNMHYEILDESRLAILPNLARLKGQFYLAGGTALALQLGHRDSIDFDFFCTESFDTAKQFEECKKLFARHVLRKTQDEPDTLAFLVDSAVSISFIRFPYPLEKPLLESEYLALASLEDIGCMKLSAITSRSAAKDYVDLYFILQSMSLETLLTHSASKLPTLDSMLILKSLVYFDDVTDWSIKYMPGHEISPETIKTFLQTEVKKVVV